MKRNRLIYDARVNGFDIAYFVALMVLIIMDGLTWDNIRLLLGQFAVLSFMLIVMRAQERKEKRRRTIIHMSDARLESLRRKEV